ncbi:MAG TPA: hypothetical protein VMB19_14705 [Silvibacterium sp.]|nr:hypothetical protein [Silvibacterium sp.]
MNFAKAGNHAAIGLGSSSTMLYIPGDISNAATVAAAATAVNGSL